MTAAVLAALFDTNRRRLLTVDRRSNRGRGSRARFAGRLGTKASFATEVGGEASVGFAFGESSARAEVAANTKGTATIRVNGARLAQSPFREFSCILVFP